VFSAHGILGERSRDFAAMSRLRRIPALTGGV
jgi:hypothetical protein